MRASPLALLAASLLGLLAAPAVTAAPADEPGTIRSFDFAAADADNDGWVMGWNKNEGLVIDDVDVEAGVGLKLSVKAATNGWGDANIKLPNLTAPYPGAVALRLMSPASAGRIKGLQIGCALNSPWSEAKVWFDFKPSEKLVAKGTEYSVQTITCPLGSADPKQTELILRFGGDRVRYQGPLFIQSIKLLKGA